MLEKWMSESSTVTAQGGEWTNPTAKTGRQAGLKLGKFSPKCGREQFCQSNGCRMDAKQKQSGFPESKMSKREKETNNNRRV